MSETSKREPATCRGCGRLLRGDAYMYGGSAYHPDTGERCPTNHYGGFVCSESCDYRTSVRMLDSMPGCRGATSPDCYAREQIARNWRRS